MIFDGLWLMLVGMTVVFSFLILLVMVMNLSAAFFDAFADYFPDPPPQNSSRAAGMDQSQIAAVLAAVYHVQNKK